MIWWAFFCGFASGAIVSVGILLIASVSQPPDPPGPRGMA